MPKDAQRSLATINAFAQAMLRHHTLDGLLWNIADLVGELLGFDDCVIYMVEGEVLVQTAALGPKNPAERQIKDPIVIPIGRGIVGLSHRPQLPSTSPTPAQTTDISPTNTRVAVSSRFRWSLTTR